ncbi:terminase small subunit [Patescibacteria group bacterium]|nr:terminase small subunit [Patescibacteria group bacterium]MBU4367695.1 terminase small subunit [Patescibacteria group bacterium]MBU4461855.1 terminase small subunit [Patescibacteria group bacterium]MCG2700014.1 terminase small subunit [Candidatus Parcubacteria bacterium]
MGKRINGQLTAKEEVFCRIFVTDRDCFSNGTQTYIKAFGGKTTHRAARQHAYRLLTKDYVTARIRELLDIYINNEVVDRELGFVITQKADLSSKVAAIREYNKVKRRIEPEGALPQTININITSDEVVKAKARILKKMKSADEDK